MFAPELASGDVVPVLEEWSPPPNGPLGDLSFGAVASAKARAFVKWFEEVIGSAT